MKSIQLTWVAFQLPVVSLTVTLVVNWLTRLNKIIQNLYTKSSKISPQLKSSKGYCAELVWNKLLVIVTSVIARCFIWLFSLKFTFSNKSSKLIFDLSAANTIFLLVKYGFYEFRDLNISFFIQFSKFWRSWSNTQINPLSVNPLKWSSALKQYSNELFKFIWLFCRVAA